MEHIENKKAHFSIDTFKKTRKLSSIIPEEPEQNTRKKRSYSYVIPKRFVPKLKPKKALVNPSYLNLNNNNKKFERNESAENFEAQSIKNFNEDDISFCSCSESSSYIEEDITQDKASNLDDDIFDIRKKLTQIKNNSSLIINNIKESNDLSTLNLKKKFSFDENCNNKFFSLKNDMNNNNNLDNDLFKINKYKSVLLYNDDKDKTKGQMPFLIFDVLTRANKNKNNL
jgi:hypothetical protein